MAVDLNNPALGLPEVKPRKQFALRVGPNLVPVAGIEPATSRLALRRSSI